MNVIEGVDPRAVARALRLMRWWQAEESAAVYEPMMTEEIRREGRLRLIGPKPSDSRYEAWRRELRRRLYGPKPHDFLRQRPREDTVRRRRRDLSTPPLRGWQARAGGWSSGGSFPVWVGQPPRRATRLIGGHNSKLERGPEHGGGGEGVASRYGRREFYNATVVRLPREECPLVVYASYEGKGAAGRLEVVRRGRNIFGDLRR